MANVCIEELRDRLEYDPDVGSLKWKKASIKYFKDERGQKIWNTRYAGRDACHRRADGRLVISIRGKKLFAHRVAFAIAHGKWPSGEVDHINGDNSDNRIVNMRDVDKFTNMRNQKIKTSNTSGVTGVSNKRGKWHAYIWHSGRAVNLGFFNCITAAAVARKAAERRYGYHPNHGRAA